MTNFKLGKKQIYASSSSGFQSRNMDESPPSLPMDSKYLNPKEQVKAQSKVKLPHGKSSIVLPNSDIDELLECPVCSNAMFPPIQQCPSGHTLCFSCKNKVNNKCPICRKEIGEIRCLALEKLAVSLQLPCTYHNMGCNEMFPYYSKLQHEENCVYRPYTCPHPGQDCSFTGDISELLSHLRDCHKVDLQTGCTFNHRYVKQNPGSVDNCSWTLTLFNCFGHYFCLHFEAFLLGNEPVYMAFLRFLGEESEARKFNYCLEVGGHGRKLKWQGVPRSIRTHHKMVRDSHDGLIIHRRLALYFSGNNQELKLRVSGKIWREM
ncbi:E3 ubiquitin-protein ligase [Canna indica]|uniref:RING-type E3 ubiquitin transferase n=1 Tax=Canna indica TaxID=4628 RepID=A0AAQ3QIT8_9LILI|nr:E3 ubiquitin-protein ligase [Canna indica]